MQNLMKTWGTWGSASGQETIIDKMRKKKIDFKNAVEMRDKVNKELEIQGKRLIELDNEIQAYETYFAAEEPKCKATIKKKKDQLASYWDSISIEDKREILKIPISDLYPFSSSWMKEIIQEALSGYDANNTCIFFCCKCDMHFVHNKSFIDHMVMEHLDRLSMKFMSIMPTVDKRLSKARLKGPWKPLDVILKDKKCKELVGFNEGQDLVPLSYKISTEDPMRGVVLESLRAKFELLISHGCLGESHMADISKFINREIKSLSTGSSIISMGLLHNSLFGCCFLGQASLEKILTLLENITQSCGIGIVDSDEKKEEKTVKKDEVKERDYMFITADASSFVLGDYFLKGDDLLESIYTSEDYLITCYHINDDWYEQQAEMFQRLTQEYCHMKTLLEKKCVTMNKYEAAQLVKDLCLEEGKKRKASGEYLPKNYDLVLRERRDELIKHENIMMIIRNGVEIDAINIVLKNAETERYHNVDTFINNDIRKMQKELYLEINKIDACILQSAYVMQHLALKLETVSSNDFKTILLALAMRYLREYLEDFAGKDATKKSEA